MAAREHKERKEKGIVFPSLRSLRSFAAINFLFISAFIATAQTNPPPASYVRSYVNDLPDQPLVTVTVTGAVNVACFTIEEILPGAASAQSISGDGVWLPSLGVIRWGPYTNTEAATVSYRLTGPSGTYPVGGGSWMDGQWYFSPGLTMVNVLPTVSNEVPPPPLQLPAPVFMPPSGADVPVNVVIGMPGSVMSLLDDTWQGGIRNIQEPPYQSAWFVSGSATNLTTATSALTLWPASGLLGIINLNANIYGDPSWGNATYPVSLVPGKWLFQLVSPDTQPGATYWSWEPNPAWGSWFTTYGIYTASGVYVGSGGMGEAGATAQAAFMATTNAGTDVTLITLTNPATLHLGVGDGIISDNLGGVSVRVTGQSPVVGITYFSHRTNAPVVMGVGDSLRATLRLAFSDQALVPSVVEPGLRVGLFNFGGSTLTQKWVSADGFEADSQGEGVNGYALFQRMGNWPAGQPIVNIRTRTNVPASDLMGNVKDFASMAGSVVMRRRAG